MKRTHTQNYQARNSQKHEFLGVWASGGDFGRLMPLNSSISVPLCNRVMLAPYWSRRIIWLKSRRHPTTERIQRHGEKRCSKAVFVHRTPSLCNSSGWQVQDYPMFEDQRGCGCSGVSGDVCHIRQQAVNCLRQESAALWEVTFVRSCAYPNIVQYLEYILYLNE